MYRRICADAVSSDWHFTGAAHRESQLIDECIRVKSVNQCVPFEFVCRDENENEIENEYCALFPALGSSLEPFDINAHCLSIVRCK